MMQTDHDAEAAIAALRGATALSLAQPLRTGIPCSPNHPGFRLSLTRRHGDGVRADGGSAAAEMIVTGGHVGTHMDAPAHVSHHGLLHGGVDAQEAQRGGRFSVLGIDTVAPIAGRGVLLDVPRLVYGVDRLAAAHAIGPDELQAAADAAGVTVGAGDTVMVRTGWAQLWDDPVAFLGHESGVPGVTADGAAWLAERGVRATGSDTTAYEHLAPGAGHSLLPAHRVLLVEAGVPIMEMLQLERLSALRAAAFGLVVAPLPIEGGTGSPINPIALVAS